MTTFDQALANLQNNSNQMAALAKGYNIDVAKFETKKAQDLSRLFLLAGEVGKDISNRLAERKAREEQSEKLWGDLFGAGEPDLKLKNEITQVEEGQVKTSDILSDSVKKNKVSPYLGFQGIQETGIGDRASEAARAYGIAAEFTASYNWTIQNDTRTFLARTNAHPNGREIALNATDLTRDEQLARLQYLQKEFTSQRVGGYSKEFLTYSQADGGSGYVASLIEQSNTIKKNIVRNINIQSGLDARNKAKGILFETSEWNESTLKTAVSLVLNSSNEEGTGIMRRDKAWNAFHDIIEDGVKTGNITREELEKIVDLEIFNINGKKTLAEHLPDLYDTGKNLDGAQGTMFKEADKYKKALDEAADNRNTNIYLTQLEQLNQQVRNKEFNAYTDAAVLTKKLGQICNIAKNAGKGNECDVGKELEKLQSIPNEQTEPKVKEILTQYYNTPDENRLPLEQVVAKFNPDVRNHADITSIISVQNGILEKNKEQIETLRRKFEKEHEELTGLKKSEFQTVSAQNLWFIQKGKLLALLEADAKKQGADRLGATTIIDNFSAKITEERKGLDLGMTWSAWEAKTQAEKEDVKLSEGVTVNDIETSPYAVDTNGRFRNATKHPQLNNTFRGTILEEIGRETIDLTSSKLLPTEETSGGKTIDYNEVIKNIDLNNIENSELGELNKICTAQEKSLLECIQTRANVLGQTLDKETIKALGGGVEGKNNPLDIALVNGNQYGWFTDDELPANISKYGDFAATLWIDQGGEEAESHTMSWSEVYPKLIDDEGKWIPEFKEAGQTMLGIDMGLLSTINPSAKQDLDNAMPLWEIFRSIPLEEKVSAVMTNDEASYEAYRNTGHTAFLPKLNNPKLKQKKENDQNSILNLLTEYNIASLTDEDIPIKSEETNQTSFQPPDAIGDSLNTNYTTT